MKGSTGEVSLKDQNIISLQGEIDHLRLQLEKVQGGEVTEYRRQITHFETQIMTYEQKIISYEQRVVVYEQRQSEYEQRMRMLSEEIERLNHTLRLKVDELGLLENRNRDLTAEMDGWRVKYNEVELRLNQQMNDGLSRSTQEIEEYRRKLIQANQDNDDLRRRVSQIENDNGNLMIEINRFKETTVIIAGYEDRLKRMAEENERLNSTINIKIQEITSYEQRYYTLERSYQ